MLQDDKATNESKIRGRTSLIFEKKKVLDKSIQVFIANF